MKFKFLCLCISSVLCTACVNQTADNEGDAFVKRAVANMQSKEQMMSMGVNEKMAENMVRVSCENVAKASATYYTMGLMDNHFSKGVTVNNQDSIYRTVQCMRALGVEISDLQYKQLIKNAISQEQRLQNFEVRKNN